MIAGKDLEASPSLVFLTWTRRKGGCHEKDSAGLHIGCRDPPERTDTQRCCTDTHGADDIVFS